MKAIPHLGVGIGFRQELRPLIFQHREKLGFVEVIADHYMDAPDEKLRELEFLKQHFTVIPHAINLSVGSAEGIDTRYLQKLKELIDFVDPPYWSEHICYTKAHGIDIGHLAPIVFNDEFLEVLKQNIGGIQNVIEKPMILENITYHVDLPGRTYSDSEFLNKLCRETGIGLLLDVTNLYINSRNMKFDPYPFIDALDLENVVQLHFVGYETVPGQVIDTHSAATNPEIFELMRYIFTKHRPQGTLLERDDRFDAHSEILHDLIKAKDLISI